MMRKTRQIQLGTVKIGGGAPVSIQSMTNTDTADAQATLAQIGRLAENGCQIVRCAVPAASALEGFARICAESPLPVVADIHFDHTLAIESLRRGAAGVRVNPGNLRSDEAAIAVARVAADLGRVVRIGVNMGSLNRQAEEKYGRTADAMVASAVYYVRLFEENGARQLKVSLKASDLQITLAANRKFAAESDLPLHIGMTETGPKTTGIIKSAVGIGALLLEGIGETVRVSLTAPPEEEPLAALHILEACGLRRPEPAIVSCPTCARTRLDLMSLVAQVEALVQQMKRNGEPIRVQKVAVMGCEVNGPGEAADADVGIAGGARGCGIVFVRGVKQAVLPYDQLLPALARYLKEGI